MEKLLEGLVAFLAAQRHAMQYVDETARGDMVQCVFKYVDGVLRRATDSDINVHYHRVLDTLKQLEAIAGMDTLGSSAEVTAFCQQFMSYVRENRRQRDILNFGPVVACVVGDMQRTVDQVARLEDTRERAYRAKIVARRLYSVLNRLGYIVPGVSRAAVMDGHVSDKITDMIRVLRDAVKYEDNKFLQETLDEIAGGLSRESPSSAPY